MKRGRPKRDFGRSLLFIIDKDVHITFYRSRKSPGRDGLLMPLTFVLHVCVFFLGGWSYAIPKDGQLSDTLKSPSRTCAAYFLRLWARATRPNSTLTFPADLRRNLLKP